MRTSPQQQSDASRPAITAEVVAARFAATKEVSTSNNNRVHPIKVNRTDGSWLDSRHWSREIPAILN